MSSVPFDPTFRKSPFSQISRSFLDDSTLPFTNVLPADTIELIFRKRDAIFGGVTLSETDRNTMQSRKVPGLFFCGERLDIDGDTGGYNIQFAISSGFLAVAKLEKERRVLLHS